MHDILIRNATVITMDPERRVIEDGAVAIDGARIAAVGPSAEVARGTGGDARKVIDGRRKAVLPGLIDCHGHAGHSLVKSLGGGDSAAWFAACETIYTRGSSEGFWAADSALAGLERLKGGVTCAVSLLGGGADIHRTDHPAFGEAHCRAQAELGLRAFLAAGPGRPPFPRAFHRLEDGPVGLRQIGFDEQLEVSEELVRRCHGSAAGRIRISVSSSRSTAAIRPATAPGTASSRGWRPRPWSCASATACSSPRTATAAARSPTATASACSGPGRSCPIPST